MQKILDANLMLRLVLNDIPDQMRAAKKLINNFHCLVPDIVVFECVYILRNFYKMPAEDIYDSLGVILNNPNIQIGGMCLEALKSYSKKPSVSYVDFYLLEYAKQQNGKLYTFDKDLIKQSDGVAVQPS